MIAQNVGDRCSMSMNKSVMIAAIGGMIGSTLFIGILLGINRVFPQGQDMISFALLTVSIVVAAYTILGACTLQMSWNDIDKRAGEIFTRHKEQAAEAIEAIQQKVIQDINLREKNLAEETQRSMNRLKQEVERGIIRQGIALLVSLLLMAIGALMVEEHFKHKKRGARDNTNGRTGF